MALGDELLESVGMRKLYGGSPAPLQSIEGHNNVVLSRVCYLIKLFILSNQI